MHEDKGGARAPLVLPVMTTLKGGSMLALITVHRLLHTTPRCVIRAGACQATERQCEACIA